MHLHCTLGESSVLSLPAGVFLRYRVADAHIGEIVRNAHVQVDPGGLVQGVCMRLAQLRQLLGLLTVQPRTFCKTETAVERLRLLLRQSFMTLEHSGVSRRRAFSVYARVQLFLKDRSATQL